MKDLKIESSTINGSGVFAGQLIKAGSNIHHLSGERCSLDEILHRVKEGKEEPSDPLGIDVEEYLDLDELSRTFNHSCDPNAYIKGESDLVAIHDIGVGEEITYDYSTTMNDDVEKIEAFGFPVWTAECNCCSKICRGIIDQFNTLSKDRQQYYIDNKFMPDYMLDEFSTD